MTDATEWVNDIHRGDARELLYEMPESSVHAVTTSPPYYGLRDYGEDDQIGLEESLSQYVEELVTVGEGIRHVLRPDGSWWLNLGDSFAGSGRGRWDGEDEAQKETYTPDSDDLPGRTSGLSRKSKMLVPHRVAIALQDAGWVVRADCVWAKPNGMPHPVKDRLRETKEFVFHLTPQPDYWFDLDAVREPHAEESLERAGRGYNGVKTRETDHHPGRSTDSRAHNFDNPVHENGKNPGDVFDIPVSSFPEAHFAVYPEELVETPIKATVPPTTCAECGTAYERMTRDVPVWEVDRSTIERPQLARALDRADDAGLTPDHFEAIRAVGFNDAGYSDATGSGFDAVDEETAELAREAKDVLGGYFREFCGAATETTGWEQACECDTDETAPGVVLDPFAGAGTTAVVAKRLGRRFIGVELNPEYVAMAQRRVGIDVDEPERLLGDDETHLAAWTDGGSRGSTDE
ncbi:DNA-methyltransferase [Halobaculum lipolyticum]|uniref:Type II methyltransferase n=1 Tax=Halobaculum lipolyticum TaxID=3032001 RepID=A0ABD5WAN5_9EURY|nr:site-specific DNA-methyltransferase [Halobaculum sp. DT31]